MADKTELMQSNSSEDIHLQAEADRISQAAGQIQGRLKTGEDVAGFKVTGALSFIGGEAELYTCEKDGGRYALKYYYKLEKNTELFDKLKKLRNPNIMTLYGYGTYKNCTFAILQFAEGGALSDRTEANNYKYFPLSEEKAVEDLNGILEGFNAIHSKGFGIIHRDIKPDNFFYLKSEKDAEDNWKGKNILIGDFGISTLYDVDEGMTSHLTESDFGTMGYEAPETYAVGRDSDSDKLVKKVSPAIDYWALGITLWVMLTGKEPFVDDKGHFLSPGQIKRNATNRQTASVLLARSPELSERMKKLIHGLLTVRSKERWNYEKVKDHLAGKDVEVFKEAVRDLPVFKVGNTECRSFMEITKALLADPVEGKKIVFGKQLKNYMWGELVGDSSYENAQQEAEKIADLIEEFSSKGKEDEGFIAVAYSLTPNLPFVVGKYKDESGAEKNAEIRNMKDIELLLENDPDILIPALRDEKIGFYTYMDVQGYGKEGEKVREVVNTTRSNLKLVPRLSAAFKNNVIAPFQDGINNGKELRTLENLDDLPDYLKERIILFIEMKKDDITAWIENLTGKDLDIWLDKYKNQKDKLISWGEWKYFKLFLNGKDIQLHRTFNTGSGANLRWGLKNNFGDVILSPVWEFVLASSPPNRYIVKRTGKWGIVQGDGTEILPLSYDLISIFDEDKGLYQCREADGSYVLINEEKKVLRKGAESLKIAGALGNPFDVVYDSKYIYSASYKHVNKKDTKFTIMETGTANYIWMMQEGECVIQNSKMEQIAKPVYTEFRAGSAGVPVKKDGKWGISSADGKKELLPCTYVDVRKGGNYFALVMPGGVGGILCEFNEAGEKKDKFWLKFDKEGGVSVLPAGGGQVIAAFRSVINLGHDYPDGGFDFAPNGKMSCMTGGELLFFDIASGQTSKRNIFLKEEIPSILKHMSAMELLVLLTNLKKESSFTIMNEIIDAAAEINPETSTNWAMEKGSASWPMILNLLDAAHTDGLANTWDIYLSWIGSEQLRAKKYPEAYNSYAKAINIKPDNPAYYAGCGAAYYHLGDYKNAFDFYTKATSLSGSKLFSAQFHAARGSALYSLTKFNEALAAFTQAITDAGVMAAAEFFTARATCYQKLNIADKAKADQDKALKAPKTSGEKIRGIPLPGSKK